MAKTVIHFMLFEKANYLAIKPLLEHLEKNSALTPQYLKGFDFKEFTGQIKPLTLSRLRNEDTLENYSGSAKNPHTLHKKTTFSPALAEPHNKQSDPGAALFNALLSRADIPVLVQQYHKNVRALIRYCEIHAPCIVVLPEDTDYIRGRMACRILRRFRCKIVVMYANYYNYFVKYPLVGERLGDIYITATRHMRNRLIAADVAEDKVFYYGSPMLDEFRGFYRSKMRQHFTFILQNKPDETNVLSDILQLMQQIFPELKLVVKPHPECALPEAIAQLKGIQLAEKNESVKSLLAHTQAVIGQSSTVIYQAIAAGIPVIIPRFDGLPLDIELPEAIASRSVVRSRSAIISLIASIVSGRYTEDANDWLVPDVLATRQITTTLESLAVS